MTKISNNILNFLVGKYIRTSFLIRKTETAIAALKAETAIAALKAIDTSRKLSILFSLWIFLLTIIAVGLIMIPISICLFSDWETNVKLIVALSFGFVYIVAPALLLIALMSEKRWLRIFHADKLVQNITTKS